MKNRFANLLIMLVISFGAASVVNAKPRDDVKDPKFLVCYDQGAKNVRRIKRSVQDMVDVIKRLAGLDGINFQADFVTEKDKCLKAINDKNVQFMIPTLGLFLRQQKNLDLVPLVVPQIKKKTVSRWYLVVKKNTYHNIKDLKGKKIGGLIVKDPELLKRIVLKCKMDPARDFVLKTSSRTLRDLRHLDEGKLDAVFVDQQEYDALGALPFGKDLEVIYKSDEVPLPPIVTIGKRASRIAKKFTKAMIMFCKDKEGKGFCELSGVDAFVPVKKNTYKEIEKLWDKCAK